jgi:hypothetical protein
MGFVDTTPADFLYKVTEDDIQNKLGDLLKANGWTKGKDSGAIATNFKKVVFDRRLLINPTDAASYKTVVAEHFIYTNDSEKMFGLAIVGEFNIPYTQYDTKPEAGLPQFGIWATNQFRKYRAPHTLYFYMVEKLQGLDAVTGDIVMSWEDSGSGLASKMLRAALDIEVEQTSYATPSGGGTPVFSIAKVEPARMQSPIVVAGMRTNLMESYYDEALNSAVQYTNWWPDSEIAIRGHIDKDCIFVVIQADAVPAPEGNLVPSIPLYFGKIDTVEEGDDACALFAGSVPPTTGSTLEAQLRSIAEFDYDSNTAALPTITPLIKTYPRNPSNGIGSVMVSRAKFGARYQSHFLSWNAPPNSMPPARTDVTNGKNNDYPRAWNNAENPLYKYQFNPSRYSGKVHTSKVYLVHPEEGVRGSLINAIGFAAVSFNASKLRVKSSFCPDHYDIYRYFLVDGISPLTKKPGTQYRPMGLGIYAETVDTNGDPVV